MDNLGKNILARVFVGLGIAMVHLFGNVKIFKGESIDIQELIQLMTALSVMFILLAVAELIYHIETWSPLKQLAIHFMTCITVFYSVNMFWGLVPLEPSPLIGSGLIFAIIYFIIWFGMRWYWTRKIASMNEDLRK
jgi:Protein of unknown function (DUF3021)